MAQFDLFRNPRGGLFPLLLDLQADLLSSLATRVVVPLTTVKRHRAKPISRLNPVVTIDGVDYVLLFQELAAIPKSQLGEPCGSLVGLRTELVRAIDLLFTGI